MRTDRKVSLILILSILILIVLILIYWCCFNQEPTEVSCCVEKECPNSKEVLSDGVEVNLDQLIFQFKNVSEDEKNNYLNELIPNALGKEILDFEDCDCGNPDLIRLKFDPFEDAGQLYTALGKVPPPTDGDMTGEAQLNIKFEPNEMPSIVCNSKSGLKIKKAIDSIMVSQIPALKCSNVPDLSDYLSDSEAPIIAVLDSGIDLRIKNLSQNAYLFKNSDDLICEGGTLPSSGWNFVDKNSNIHDESNHHGTYVTKILVDELEAIGVEFRILPLKIASNNNFSYWDLLCAMSFIEKVQEKTNESVKLINASFGFEINKDESNDFMISNVNGTATGEYLTILKSFIGDLNSSSLFITAAGNGKRPVDLLTNVDFFPVEFELENIIGVGGYKTSNLNGNIFEQDFDKHCNSNFGSLSVDLAAPWNYNKFSNDVSGTSFSTPFVTAAIFEQLTQGLGPDIISLKDSFLISLPTAVNLEAKFVEGRIIEE